MVGRPRLRGERVGLRAREQADVGVLHAELYEDVASRSRADTRARRPIPVELGSPFAAGDPSDRTAAFSVVELATGELAGAALWNIDLHNRVGHLGVSLRPVFRGRGFGTVVVRVPTGYGFATRGLHRLPLETLADNQAMLAAATGVGYRKEGLLRKSAWVNGAFSDEVILGLLADEWRDQPLPPPGQ